MSIGFRNHQRHRYNSGAVSPTEISDAEDFILEHITIDSDHDVPFCAGVSHDGQTLYIDHEIYKEIEAKKGYLKSLVIHELVEHCLMRMLGMKYLPAHNIATEAEEASVRAEGISQDTYNRDWDRWIRRVASRKEYPNVPDDIDTEPYVDEGDGDEVHGGKTASLMGTY